MKLLLNAKPFLHPTTLTTWGEWLETLDADSDRTGQIVSAVRFNGVDEPSYRTEELCSSRLDVWAEIDVDTASTRMLVARTLADSAIMAGALAGDASRVGEAYRQSDLYPAQQMLPALVDGIRTMAAITETCAMALGLRTEDITCEGTTFHLWLDEFGRRLAVVLEAEGHHDWITLADSLEYEIEPSLREWATLFDEMATSAAKAA